MKPKQDPDGSKLSCSEASVKPKLDNTRGRSVESVEVDNDFTGDVDDTSSVSSESRSDIPVESDTSDMPGLVSGTESSSLSTSDNSSSASEWASSRSDSGNSEVQWGNPLNSGLRSEWLDLAVAVSDGESDWPFPGWTENVSSNSNESQHPSDDGLGLGVVDEGGYAYLEDLAFVGELRYANDEEADDNMLPQDDQGYGIDFNGVERGGGTRETVSQDDGLQLFTIDGESELVANVLGGVLGDERSRIQIELIDGMGDDLSGIPGEFNK